MLVGARQTGKTYIIEDFCKNEFQNYIYKFRQGRRNKKDI